jgi:hypothetical protein
LTTLPKADFRIGTKAGVRLKAWYNLALNMSKGNSYEAESSVVTETSWGFQASLEKQMKSNRIKLNIRHIL